MDNQPRDQYGRFVKITTPPLNPEFEKPLVQVSITNPLRKILYWLDQIRKKQTTTFVIKLSIPLIALPLFAFAFFQLGRNFTSFAIPSSSNPKPIPSPKVLENPEVDLSKAGTLKVARGQTTKYLLSLKDGGIILLNIPPNIDLKIYQNKQILVTGLYTRKTNTLKVTDLAEIETLNEVTIATPSTQQTP